jgi:hypothetical protein
MRRISQAIRIGRAVDRLRFSVMSAKITKPESARTIFRKRDGTYVAARDEGGVKRVYRLHVVKSNLQENLVVERDCTRAVLVAAATEVAMTAYVVEDADDITDLKIAAAEFDWSIRRAVRALKDALER